MENGRIAAMFMAMSRFVIANGLEEGVRQAFAHRPHLVEEVPGFVRMDVLSPTDASNEFWLMTYWTDEQSYRTWHRGHRYKDSHSGIPKGLKLVRGCTQMRYFRHIAS
jgi:heme oxygenase (mycobilin-producing)